MMGQQRDRSREQKFSEKRHIDGKEIRARRGGKGRKAGSASGPEDDRARRVGKHMGEKQADRRVRGRELQKEERMAGKPVGDVRKQRSERADRERETLRDRRQDGLQAAQRESARKKWQTGREVSAPEKETAASDAPRCPYAKKCGGCDYQGIDYASQLEMKQALVRKYVGSCCKVLPIIGMEEPYHYRNKVHAVFDIVRRGSGAGKVFTGSADHGAGNAFTGGANHGAGRGAAGKRGGRLKRGGQALPPGTIISGVYAGGTHEVIPVDSCLIEDETADAIIRDIRGLLRSFKIKTYDEDTGYGLLRHVLVRRGFQSGEVMVVLVLGDPILPSKNNFVKALRKLHPEITTIILNVNDKKTSMVLGERNIVLYGKGYIEDQLCGRTFRISPNSFYQVNPVQTEILYGKAIGYAGLTGKERIVDAYCGTGTIGLIAAARAKEGIGIELNPDAVRDAITNAKRNGVKNIRFFQADAGEYMVEMAARGERVDVLFMDPPRAGSDEAFLSAVVKLGPKRVVYISCNPETLARDMNYLVQHGYEAVECQPVDLFPWTKHIESIVLLSKLHTKQNIEVELEMSELDLTAAESKATYAEIKQYVLDR